MDLNHIPIYQAPPGSKGFGIIPRFAQGIHLMNGNSDSGEGVAAK